MIWRDFSNSVIKRNIPRRMVACLASKGRGKAPKFFNKWQQSGRWGVVPASEHQEILVALASLIRAKRYDMALTILDNELGGGC
tara:strand:- start:45 stop:296 length:252 start_codon:yes stop_codon:yes gene_type:complete